METIQHQGRSLAYITVHPDEYDPQRGYPLIILLHGFGANMQDLAGLAPSIDRKGYVYACPNGPLQVEIGPGMVGYAWTARGQAGGSEQTQEAQGLLATFFDEVIEQYHVPPGRVLLCGFSQGGRMTYLCGLGRPDLFTGLVAMSAVSPTKEDLQELLPVERTQSIFISHGVHDPLISVERARETRDHLEEAGYKLYYQEYEMAHTISAQVLKDLVPWIDQMLPPA